MKTSFRNMFIRSIQKFRNLLADSRKKPDCDFCEWHEIVKNSKNGEVICVPKKCVYCVTFKGV